MGQLYRWIETQTGKVVYVGQVVGDKIEDIYSRIKAERTQFPWTKEKDYVIQYLSGSLLGRSNFNRNETTALETHFINLYRTGENGYNRNHQSTGGAMTFVPEPYESAWEDIPPLTRQPFHCCLEPPYDIMKLNKIRDSFIRNGARLLELEEIFFYVLFDYVNELILDKKITVYCNKYLGLTFGITFNGRYYGFFDSTVITNDSHFLRCIDGVPVDPEVFHWTGQLRPDAVSNIIECKPYLDDLRERVMKARAILEQYNPDLIANMNAVRFQKIYQGLSASKHKKVDELVQKALDKKCENAEKLLKASKEKMIEN